MLKPETERMRTLLVDAITTLCRSGLQYSSELKVEGLLGITLDASDIILVSVNQKFDKPGIHVSVTSAEQVDSSAEELELEVPSEQSQSPDKSTPVKRPHSATKSNHSNSKAKRRKALQRDEEGSLSSEKQSASESQVEPPFTVISGLDNSNDSVNETNATQDKTSGSDNSSAVKPSSNMQPSTSVNQPLFPTIKIEIEDDSNDGKVKMEPDELLLQSASSDQQNTSGSGPMPVLLSQNITQTGLNPGFSETDASMLQFGNMSNLLGLSQPSTSSTNSSPRFPGSKTKPVKAETDLSLNLGSSPGAGEVHNSPSHSNTVDISNLLGHLPAKIPPTESNDTPRRRCRMCRIAHKTRKESYHYCPKCPKQPALCLLPCFNLYHKSEEFLLTNMLKHQDPH